MEPRHPDEDAAGPSEPSPLQPIGGAPEPPPLADPPPVADPSPVADLSPRQPIGRRVAVPAEAPAASERTLRPLTRVLTVALLIGLGALAGLLLTRGDAPATSRDALSVLFAAAEGLTLEFETDDPDRASRFIADAYGRRLTTPELRGYALRGVAPAELDEEATTPALVYENASEQVAVVSLDYALLDAAGARLALSPNLRGLLSDDVRVFQHETPEGSAVFWRDRDDLFFAFPADPQALLESVVMPQR